MVNLKHVGRVKATSQKVLVAFRTLPGDSANCLVIITDQLDDSYHNAIINLVESNAAQTSYEFAEALDRTQFPDGSRMLPSLHSKGKLVKMPTADIEMIPAPGVSVLLSELNQIIAEQRGVAVDDLALKPAASKDTVEAKEVASVNEMPESNTDDFSKTTSSSVNNIEDAVANLSPDEKAKKFRSEADRLAKEAAKFRRLAEDLVPTKKKSAQKN